MKKICLFSFLLYALLFFSCNDNKITKSDSKVVCILFDLSETTNTPEIRNNYLNKFKMVLNSMHSGDALEAALITEKSLSELDFSINYEFPTVKSRTNTELFEKAAKTESDSILQVNRDSILLVVDSVLLKPKRKISKTEIMGSLQVAERVFKSFNQPSKVLVVFSDMIEDSKDYNFVLENLTKSRIKKIIDLEKQKNSLPDLKDVKVYVAGASHPDSKKYNQIKNFWFEYFKSTGAKLDSQNYGAALINFNE